MITIGPAWKIERATIVKIRRAPNGIVVGELPDARPLSDGHSALAMIVVGCVGFVCLAWFASRLGPGVALAFVVTSIWSVFGRHLMEPDAGKLREKLRRAAVEAHGGARLRAYAHASDTAGIEAVTDVPFEPVIVARNRLIPRMRYILIVGFLAMLVCALMLRPILPFEGLLLVCALAAPVGTLIFWFCAKLNPWYFRITPGRMDLFRFEPFRRRREGVVLNAWDLRDARIELFDSVVTIRRGPDDDDDAFRIPLKALAEPTAFAQALYRAAISTHEAPALPDEQL
ncbi:MAG TPA: hypothetical protein P5081_00945 [Phycisphaerae bacterium]|nr:hypothetical protein [Phycisphaerae bacterium]HRW51419.1 hypothetical protein [Phycisphaerae bacterium]